MGSRLALRGAVLASALLLGSAAHADLQLKQVGKELVIDASSFPEEQQKRNALFTEKCSKCHSLRRPIGALVSGRTPISGDNFEPEDIKKYVVKMMRKVNSGIDKRDARELVLFLQFARTRARE